MCLGGMYYSQQESPLKHCAGTAFQVIFVLVRGVCVNQRHRSSPGVDAIT